jgi:3-methylfumaryl-CoA hydratase
MTVHATSVTRTDTIGRWPASAYRATFASNDPVDEERLPPGWHKLYFLSTPTLDGLRPDGTPNADGVTPEIELPRRLYAGEELAFHRPIRYGETLELSTRLRATTEKEGSHGHLVFVTLESSILAESELVVSIRQHDVFLGEGGEPRPLAPGPGSNDLEWVEETELTPAHLFRYSALTFNTHRIHYDRDWVRQAEGQPDLLVHGPLLEMLLLDFVVRNAGVRAVAGFSVRIHAPTFVDTPVRLAGISHADRADLWVLDAEGGILVSGSATWA